MGAGSDYARRVRGRGLFVAILAAGLVAVVALSAVSKGHDIEVGMPFGLTLSLVVFGLAVVGNRFAWGVAFVVAVFGAAFTGVWAVFTSSPDRSLGVLASAVWVAAALALWGLKPEDERAPGSPEG